MSRTATRFAPLPPHLVKDAVAAALAEDLGLAGDITTNATVAAETRADAVIAARKPGSSRGSIWREAAFAALDPAVMFEAAMADGAARGARHGGRPRVRQRPRAADGGARRAQLHGPPVAASPR